MFHPSQIDLKVKWSKLQTTILFFCRPIADKKHSTSKDAIVLQHIPARVHKFLDSTKHVMDSQLFANFGSMVALNLFPFHPFPHPIVPWGLARQTLIVWLTLTDWQQASQIPQNVPSQASPEVLFLLPRRMVKWIICWKKKSCWRWKLHVILATAASDLAKTTIFQPFCFPLLTRLRADRPKRGLASPKKWHLECQWVTPWGVHLQLVLPDISHFLMVCTLCRQRSWLNSGGRMFRSQN